MSGPALRVTGRLLKALALVAASERQRYALNYVRVQAAGEVTHFESTDGRIALRLVVHAASEANGYIERAAIERLENDDLVDFTESGGAVSSPIGGHLPFVEDVGTFPPLDQVIPPLARAPAAAVPIGVSMDWFGRLMVVLSEVVEGHDYEDRMFEMRCGGPKDVVLLRCPRHWMRRNPEGPMVDVIALAMPCDLLDIPRFKC